VTIAVLVISGLATAGTLIAVLRRRLTIVTLTGTSMEPTYRPGDRLLVRRSRPRRLRRGDAVLVRDPRPLSALRPGDPVPPPGGLVVKRIVAVPGDAVPPGSVPAAVRDTRVPAGSYVVLGDNPAVSADSRVHGFVPADRVVGVVTRSWRESPRPPWPWDRRVR
jgi:signal peptidase I